MLSKIISRAACVAALFFIVGCGSGDDDGRRLGEIIVGIWQRGWGEGDVVIEGDTELGPENFLYDRFVFNDDGSYNGMLRKGSFVAIDVDGDIISEGTYQCDNHNLKLESVDGQGRRQTILALVESFTDDTIQLQYVSDDYNVTVTLIIRKLTAQNL